MPRCASMSPRTCRRRTYASRGSSPSLRALTSFLHDARQADVCPKDPEQIQALLSLAALPGVHVKISHTWALSEEGYPWADVHPLVETVVRAFGASRCMFASDWPVCMMPAWPGGDASYSETVSLAREEYGKLLHPDEMAMLLGGTAEKIWFSP